MRIRSPSAICLWIAFLLSGDCLAASMNDVPRPLRIVAECMLRVLKKTPSADHARLGVVEKRQVRVSTDKRAEEIELTGRHPIQRGWGVFVEYQTTNKKGERGTIRLNGEEDCGIAGCTDLFTAGLSGLAAGGEEPSDWGTGILTKKWKKECNTVVEVFWE